MKKIFFIVFLINMAYCNAQQQYTIKCAFCNKVIPASSKFCNYCGKKQDSKNYCIKCNKEIPKDASFCSFCGIIQKKVDKKEQTVAKKEIYKTFIDSRDGKIYKIIKIGNQIWMAENLNFKTNNGSWCYNDKPNNCDKYGRLYEWKTAINNCPDGWHLPSNSEWTQLIDYLGGESVAGRKLKESGTIHWTGANLDDTNSSGFNAIPGGIRWNDGRYENVGNGCYLWSSTNSFNEWSSIDKENSSVFNRNFYSRIKINLFLDNSAKIFRNNFADEINYGFSVRCIKN